MVLGGKRLSNPVLLLVAILFYFTQQLIPVHAAELSKAEEVYLKEKGTIFFVSQTHYPPFEFLGSDGDHTGMSIDLVRWIATEFGFKVHFTDTSFKQAQNQVLAEKADILTSLFYSKKRDEVFDFTQVLFEVPASIFVLSNRSDIKEMADLQGKVVAIQAGDSAEDFLGEKQIPCTFSYTSNFAEATDLVIKGKADAIIGDEQIVLYHIFSNGLTEQIKKVGVPLYIGKNCMGAKDPNPMLVSIMNKGVDSAQEKGVFDRIYKKWIGVQYFSKPSWIKQHLSYVFIAVGGILLAAVLGLVWNIKLRQMVIARTTELSNSEKTLRAILTTSPLGIALIRGRIMGWHNPAMNHMSGYTPDELEGRDIAILYQNHPLEDLAHQKLKDGFQTPSHAAVETQWVRKDGTVFDCQFRYTPLKLDDDTSMTIVIAEDISNRKRGEKILQEEREDLVMTLESNPHGIVIIDTGNKHLYVNSNFTNITGYTLEEIPTKQDWFQKAYPDAAYREKIIKTWKRDTIKQGTIEGREFTIKCKNGQSKHIEFKSTVLKDKTISVLTDVTQRRQAEEALKRSEQRLSVHLQNTPVGAISWDLEFNVVEWNPAAERIFGYKREDVIGKHLAELIVPEDVKGLVDGVFQDLFAGKGGVRSINENLTRAGRRILCDWFNTTLKDPNGKVVGGASLVNDITDRKRSEDINKTLFAISNAVNITFDLNDLYKQIHRLLAEIIDVTNFYIAIVNEKKRTFYFPYHVDTFDQKFPVITDFNPNESITGLVISQRKPRLLRKEELKTLAGKNGVWGLAPMIWMGVPMIIKNEVIGVIAVQSYTDPHLYSEQDLKVLSSISEQVAISIDRKRAEDDLRDNEKRYRHLFNNAPAGMYEIDFVKRRFVEVNSVLCKYTGYLEQEFLSIDPLELLTEKSKGQFEKAYEATLRGEKISTDVEYEIISKDGQTLLVILNSEFIYENKKLTGARVVVHDITERKKIENMIIQSEKMMSVGGLAAGMAHEINNPLAGMMQNSQVIHNRLTKEIPANEKIAQELGTSMDVIKKYMEKREVLSQLESINIAGTRAAKIIRNMLSFVRKRDSAKAHCKLDELLGSTIELAQNDYDLKKNYDFRQIEIIREYAPDFPPVPCEASKIQQVLFNLLKNASESMASQPGTKKPELTIRLIKHDKIARIEIEDNGPGMDEEIRKRIFEPFFTTKSVDKGTGLGLSVSYFIIVEDHGGTIEVESTPGKGTKFIIDLPFDLA